MMMMIMLMAVWCLTFHINTLNWYLKFYTALITAAFGGLDLHGAPRGDSWTQLNQTANAGDTQLTVQSPVDWIAGDVIVLAPTSYSTWEAEKLTISAISADKMTLTFTPALQFKHIGKCTYSCIYIKINIFWLQLTLVLSIKCCIYQSNIKILIILLYLFKSSACVHF